MNPSTPSPRRTNPIIYYAIGILVLFVAMGFYTEHLNRLKAQQGLGEATIGQVDTGSFMLKLALLGGARGVAANVLWTRAIDLQKVHEWDRLMATVNLITKLQPHFLSVWTFQGWNLAYNVSVEWDAAEDKYEWIKKGIVFLKDGVSKNENSPDLVWDTAWTYYHKIGFADEAVVLRKLFHDDEDKDFKTYIDAKTGVAYERSDNFQLGYGWFSNAVAKVDAGQERLASQVETPVEYVDKPTQRKGRPGDLAFRSMPAHAQTRYAIGLEKESIKDYPAVFGEFAQIEWNRAFNEWLQFGQYPFPAFNDPDQMIYLDDSTNLERYNKLSDNAKYWTTRWSDQMNYRYWKDRSAAEMEKKGVEARQLFYEGFKALKAGRFVDEKDKNGNLRKGAVTCYREGLELWKDVLSHHPDYRNDELNMKDTGHIVKRYLFALRQAGMEPPPDIPFLDKAKAVQDDRTIDPFDALEVIHTPSKVKHSSR
ncbi:MAG: hypothetical protein IRY99_02750 [Isosphaeraceae bacterium]|nr:hypothetical protein [Isosphaeraceae bacterium]